jgi:NADH-quinone oxidoreductase subunit N
MRFAPELICFFSVAVFLVLAMARQPEPVRNHRASLFLSGLGVLVCLAAMKVNGDLFAGVYRVDFFSQVFKLLLSIGLFCVLCLCSELNGISRRYQAEVFLLLFACTLAMMLLVSGVHLLSIYVALELSSYCLYILVSLRKDAAMGLEAGLKYFLVGISASAVMLFGISVLYGTTGALHLNELMRILPHALERPVVMVGLFLTLSGFFFKLALCPFHIWAPDAYQGGANQVAAYIATVSKVAAAAVLMRVVGTGALGSGHLVYGLAFLSIATMTIGNLAAIGQTDLKRLLAYSSIAHAGYILIGILSVGAAGPVGVVFYAAALLLMKLSVFFVVIKVACTGENPGIADLAGLHRRAPILALLLLVTLFSLAGIPPFIGFTAKLLIFTGAMKAGHFGLVLVAMLNVVVSLYYYLLVLKAAYFLPYDEAAPRIPLSVAARGFALCAMLLMVTGGIYPGGLVAVADAAIKALMQP